MRRTALLVLAASTILSAQIGHISGTIVDDAGAPVQGATVWATMFWTSAPLSPGQPPAMLPFTAKAPTGAKGDFAIDVTYVGQYHICVEKPDAALLNPCLWSDAPVPVNVASGATVSGVTIVAVRGISITVRVDDVKGIVAANQAAYDIRIGTSHRATPFIPGRITARDPVGHTVSLIVPKAQPAAISVSSAAFTLADDKGAALNNTTITIPPGLLNAAPAAAVATVHITGKTH